MFVAIDTETNYTRYINTDQILTIFLYRDDPLNFPKSWTLKAVCNGARNIEIAKGNDRMKLASLMDEIIQKGNGQR